MHGWLSTKRVSQSSSGEAVFALCAGGVVLSGLRPSRLRPLGGCRSNDGRHVLLPSAAHYGDRRVAPSLRKNRCMPTHKVRFQPVGIEIEVNEDETVLNAAFRQGVSLTHGCREGQCSACKSFLLDGDLEMEKYSTFALPEYESDEGYVLLCRSHAYSDLEVELINYDEDILRLGIPIVTLQTTVAEIEPLTHDIKRLVLKIVEPGRMMFTAGQYADILIPG